jgi:dTDP-4-amino-4,6-dideoxygalactose transaminase
MDGFQSAVLKIKLAYIDDWNKKREKLAAHYISRLKDCNFVQLPLIQKGNTHVFHLFVIIAERRDNLKIFLQDAGISTGIHYPTPLPFLPVYKSKYNDYRNLFPNASANENMLLSLPIYPDLCTDQIEYVTDKMKEFYK